MPAVNFEMLPPDARVWVFASDRPLRGKDSATLLTEVDRFLAQWKAHGAPLRCGRDWMQDRFLAIGVDPTVEQASGCSIDGLFRGLQSLERELNTRLVAGGRVFYRDASGQAQTTRRADIVALSARAELTGDTMVFDTSVTTAVDWRERFERPARDTWVASLLGASGQDSQPSSRSATKSSSVKNG
jgi:hypothetical protein